MYRVPVQGLRILRECCRAQVLRFRSVAAGREHVIFVRLMMENTLLRNKCRQGRGC